MAARGRIAVARRAESATFRSTSSATSRAGVPPLELTGERTLPDVPEENYWFRRHLVVYEWIARARAAACASSTWPAARATAPTCWRARAARVVGVDANPEALRARARCATRAPNLRFERDAGRDASREPLRRGRVPADDRARAGPGRGARALPLAAAPGRRRVYVSTPNVLTLAPQGAERSGNPWHVHEYRAEEFRALCARALRRGRAATASSTPASCARTSSRSSAGWDAVHPRLGITERFYDWFTPAISDARLRAAAEPTRDLDARARLPRGVPAVSRATRGRARARPAHAHALRRGLRHLAVRRGVAVGGDRDVLPAAARRARRAGRRVTLSLTPVLCDQLEAPRRRRRALRSAFLRDVRAADARLDVDAAAARAARTRSPPSSSAPPATTRAPRSASRRSAGDAARRAARRTRRGRRRPRTRCCRCWPPTPACACRCRPGIDAHRRALRRRLGAAASGCPSARTRRGSTRCSRRRACTRPAST